MSTRDFTSAGKALAEALIDDPFYRLITIEDGLDEPRRLDRLSRYFQCSLLEGTAIGQVETAGADGAAIWITCADEALIDSARNAKLRALQEVLGPQGFENYANIVRNMERGLPTGVDGSAWYLSIIGVSPHRQSRGLGGALMTPTLELADSRAATCFLETFNERSLPFYERLGVVVIGTRLEEVTSAKYAIMLREPKKMTLAA